MNMKKLIEIKNCRVEDSKSTPIKNLSFTLEENQAWLITGPNGGGKADFIKALSGEKSIVKNNTDSIYENSFLDSTEVVSLEVAAKLIEQERELDESEYMDRLDEGRSGRRFLCEVLGGPDAKHRHIPLPPIAQRLETLPEIKLCGIEHILDRGLKLMSTGEIRRTLLCRALLSKKKLLVLSDPFAGLDAQSRAILLEFFQTIAGKSSYPKIILSMERYTEIPSTITNVAEFKEGCISFTGTKSEYEKVLEKRNEEKTARRDAEKSAFLDELKKIEKDTESVRQAVLPRTNSEDTLIQMNCVNVGWGEKKVLTDFSWTVLPGEHWLIRGPNGSGKTTLLELITGDNHQVFSNDVWLFGKKRGTGETIWDIKRNLGIVSYRLHVEYRMLGGTDLEAVIISGFKDSIGLYEQRTELETEAARKWLKLAGFEGREKESFGNLSYGEQRAILIIRAAVKSPKILILDEPCHGLDENFRQKILDLLERIAQTGTTTLLHVTHDPAEALPCERHILELHPGETPMYQILVQNSLESSDTKVNL